MSGHWKMMGLVGFLAMPVLLCAGGIEEDFDRPPVSVRPYVWWHWMGPNFSKEGITKDLEAMKDSGIGGATIFNITSGVQESSSPLGKTPWPQNTYRGPAYWDAMRHAAREAGRLGLELGLHNTVGYSTTGGPWIDQTRGMQRLVWSETLVQGEGVQTFTLPRPEIPPYRGWGGGTKAPITYFRDIVVLAVPAEGNLTRDKVRLISERMAEDGTLTWRVPPGLGAWKIYRFGHAPTGATPHPVPDDVLGLAMEADKMSAEQTRFHWTQVLQPLRACLGPEFGRSFRHVLIDSYEAGDQNWTPRFREEFRRMKGYDPVPWLVTLGQILTGDKQNRQRRILGTEEETARFEYDYRDVVEELYRTRGWEPARDMVHREGLELHFEPYSGPFDTVAGAALADVPMGEFWNHSSGGISAGIVPAARAAGRRIIAAEAFTGLPVNSRWDETPARLRRSADGAFSAGVNRLVLHHWVHQPLDDRFVPGFGMGWWGVHFGRHQTWLDQGREFFLYLARTQVLLQRGHTPVDVLGIGRPEGGGDVVPPHVLDELRVDNGHILTPGGRSYRVLTWNHGGALLPQQVARLLELVRDGAVLVSPRPTRSPSLRDYPSSDAEVNTLADELWGRAPGAPGPVRVGSGRVYPSTNTQDALRDLGLDRPMVSQDKGSANVRVLHRRVEEESTDLFFVSSDADQPVRASLSFRITGRLPEIWDAEEGSRKPARDWRVDGDRTQVALELAAGHSCFVVFRRPTAGLSATPVPAITTRPLPVKGPWEVSFTPGWGAPGQAVFPQLASWSDHSDPGIRYFSGTAVYRTKFDWSAGETQKGPVWLDLGDVRDLAGVRLNGRDLRTLWCPPYRVEVSQAIQTGGNTLEVSVSNTWHNRLIGDEQEPADVVLGKERTWGKDKVFVGRPLVGFPDWVLQGLPRPSTGRKCFVTWNYFTKDSPLIPAGLLGPVVLEIQVPVPTSNR
ncbi:MAG: glycosyl hydrolase [Candidatus Methylacidiphilales bacterium]|nr:glycosyl hydrolase [Candidatus Methylacidiphilales bacterium]